MSNDIPDIYDPEQPDLPTKAVDPEPATEPDEGVDLTHLRHLEDDKKGNDH